MNNLQDVLAAVHYNIVIDKHLGAGNEKYNFFGLLQLGVECQYCWVVPLGDGARIDGSSSWPI